MKDKLFKRRSLRQNVWATLVLGVSLVVVAAAQRDLQQRAPSELNGNKLMWRLLCLNAIGALSYFRWGRRATPA